MVNEIFKSASIKANVTVTSSMTKTSIKFTTQDNGTAKLIFNITKDNGPLPLSSAATAKIFLRMADGSVFEKDTTIIDPVNGQVEYILVEEINHPGTVKGEMNVYFSNGQSMTVCQFQFAIEKTVKDRDIVPLAEYFVKDFNSLQTDIEQRAAVINETVDEMQAKVDEFESTAVTLDPRLTTVEEKVATATTQIEDTVGKFDFVSLPTDGYFWGYDAATNKWKPKPPPAGGGESVIYSVELSRWGIKNDETNPINTTKGINDAMAWAVKNGYTEIVLPKGTYLIDKDNRIEPQSHMTLNLNGSTLKKETNGYESYAIVSYRRNQKFSRITNGKIQGDKPTHDYTTVAGTHEGGYGIEFGSFATLADGGNNARFIQVDNLEIFDCTGDSINFISDFGQITPTPLSLASSWEQGTINAITGVIESSTTKIRSNLQISMTQARIVKYGYFGLYGNGFGSLGADILTDYYDVFFYKSDNSFISTAPNVQFFEEVEVPTDANYARIVIHQPSIPLPANCLINVRCTSFPQWIYVENCNLHHSRRQGLSVCGAKNIYIRDNEIHHIGGVSPMSGIDVEDGYDLNQYIHIDNNNFHHNERYNLITVNGKHMHVTNNTFMPTITQGYLSVAINGGTDKAVVTGNVIKLSKVSLAGEVIFSDNYIFGTQVTVNPVYATRTQTISNNVFHNCKFVMDSPFPYLVKMNNCRFLNDDDKARVFGATLAWTLELKNEPQTISGCTFEGQDYSYLTSSTAGTYKGGWIFENCRFKNTKSVGLFSGTYVDCIFTDLTGSVPVATQTGGADTLELRNCKFYSNDTSNTQFTFGSMKSLKVIDCHIEKSSGWLIKIAAISGEVILRGNTFKIVNDLLPRTIVILDSTFTGNSIILEGNKISSTNSTRVGIENLTTNNPVVIVQNNVLTKATITRSGKEVMQNNILDGLVDSYFKVSAEPTSGYYKLSQKLENTTLTPGGYLGWVCITEGIANNVTWAASTAYTLNTLVNANGKVYKCTVAGTSGTTAPSQTTGSATDGTVTWEYQGNKALFKQYGLIQS